MTTGQELLQELTLEAKVTRLVTIQRRMIKELW